MRSSFLLHPFYFFLFRGYGTTEGGPLVPRFLPGLIPISWPSERRARRRFPPVFCWNLPRSQVRFPPRAPLQQTVSDVRDRSGRRFRNSGFEGRLPAGSPAAALSD